MEIFGIGPLELVAILLIVFIVMGPSDMAKMGATVGRALRKLRQSDTWRAIQDASREIRSLPDNLARQAGADEIENLKRQVRDDLDAPRKQIEAIDREFIAWTRKPEQQSQKARKADEEENEDRA